MKTEELDKCFKNNRHGNKKIKNTKMAGFRARSKMKFIIIDDKFDHSISSPPKMV